MVVYRSGYATVYILENLEAGLVKVGITINSPADRLKSLADLWSGRYGTCQVCGGRRLIRRGRLPEHRKLGARCAGSGEPSLERESSVAEWYLRVLQERLGRVSGVEIMSVKRMITRLEKVIAQPRHAEGTIGSWRLRYEVFTEQPEQAEYLAHSFLARFVEVPAPHGEVFRCGFEEARAAVERALEQLGVAHTAEAKLHE
jgi:hypothetical protein